MDEIKPMATPKKISKELAEEYLELLQKIGEEGLYQRTLGVMNIPTDKMENPDIEVLDFSDAFISRYRSTGEEAYLTIGKILRKAAHKIYRNLLEKDKTKKINTRFLNLIKT